ncbi:hypothetical protein MKW92_009575 [Papaver armeniacum]|nr:hypothetical protein MKW92_009575 [Papaver armeniacum]
MSGYDSKYFSKKEREIPELKDELNSQYKVFLFYLILPSICTVLISDLIRKRDAVKKVIAAMTVGKDVSSPFTDVVNCMQTENLELKKLFIYILLIMQKKSQPDLAIFCCEIHSLEDRGFLDTLKDLISDNNPMVVANAVAALQRFRRIVETNLKITSHTLSKLLTALNECTDHLLYCADGVKFILDALSKYKAADAREAENIVERVTPRLQHANCAVVLSAVKMILQQMELITSTDVARNLCKKMIQYVALRNINLIVQRRPTILAHEIKVTLMSRICHEVDVDFVRKAVRAIGRCAIKLERAAERCISVLLELIKIKVNYVVQEAIISYFLVAMNPSIATLCESLDTFRRTGSEVEVSLSKTNFYLYVCKFFSQASMIWIIGEYAERIDNADELLESFLESFPEEPALVQLQLLTATVKLFLKKPTEGPQQMIQVVLNNATVETDNPDLRDRAYIYWRLLSTDPEAAKDVVLAEKPVISDDSNQLDSSLLDELLANIATLCLVKAAAQRPDDDEYPDGAETGFSESSVNEGMTSPSASSSSGSYAATRQAAPAPAPAPAPVPDLLGDLMGLDNALVPTDQPTSPRGPPLPVVLPAATGQGLQISAQVTRQDGQVPQLQPGTTVSVLLPMVLLQNLSPGPPTSLLQVAVKNNQQPVWYFNDKVSLLVLFSEDGRMERANFLETWKSLPDSNEVTKDLPGIVVNSVEATLDKLAASNMFFIAKRRHANQEVLYLSAKIPRGIPFLIELTAVIGIPGVKCAIKTPSPEMAPLFFEALEIFLKG